METAIPSTEKRVGVPPLERPLPKPSPLQIFWERWGPTVITIINLSVFIYLWQLSQGGAEPLIDTRWIPTPLDLGKSIIKNIQNGNLWRNASFSATTFVLGLGSTIVLGVPLGIFLGLNRGPTPSWRSPLPACAPGPWHAGYSSTSTSPRSSASPRMSHTSCRFL